MKLTWLGHACWHINVDGTSILIDPFFASESIRKIGEALQVDYILCTHGHADHCSDVVSISKLHPNAVLIGCFELVNWFGKKGVRSLEPGNPGGTIETSFGSVTFTFASHSSQMPDGAYGGIAVGFVINTKEGSVYVAGDTGFFSDMVFIGRAGLKAAIVPIGDRFTMGPEQALEAIKLLKPEIAIPSHYNTWVPIQQDPDLWAKEVQSQTSSQPLVFQPGESKEI